MGVLGTGGLGDGEDGGLGVLGGSESGGRGLGASESGGRGAKDIAGGCSFWAQR